MEISPKENRVFKKYETMICKITNTVKRGTMPLKTYIFNIKCHISVLIQLLPDDCLIGQNLMYALHSWVYKSDFPIIKPSVNTKYTCQELPMPG